MKPRVVAIIQARTSSSRLPRKVLARIGPVTMLERLLGQLRGCTSLDAVMVATSTHPDDDALEAHLRSIGVPVYRGDLDDVLARFAGAAREARADVAIRLTGDCPLHTPDTVDEVVGAFLSGSWDYANNMEPYTRPDGLDVEVMSVAALEEALAEARPGPDREHVTPWLRRAPGVRRLYFAHVSGPAGGDLRWTVDEPGDLEYARRVWAVLDARGPGPFRYEDVMTAATMVGRNTADAIVNRGYYTSLFDAASGSKAAARTITKSEAMLERSAKVIPGGAQTYSKSWKQHVRGVSPIFLDRGAGPRVWDVDGNEYVDLVQGLLPNILGYAHPEVDRAAYARAQQGHSFSLAHPLEVELAERLTKLVPCAELVRFGKNGSDATAGAVRVARAFTGRDRVACCGYHGWQDWYIGSTSRWAGVPKAVRELTHPFVYNDLASLEAVLSGHPGEFAAVILEPFNFTWPAEGFLAGVQDLARRHGAVLIFDEICTGFHLGLGGAQKLFGVTPDLAAFGKAMGNGYPISCIVGRRDIMKRFDDVFVSFTFAGDVAALAASMQVLDVLERPDTYARMSHAGQTLRDGALAFAQAAGLADRFQVHGHSHWLLLKFLDGQGKEDPVLRALWLQEVTRRGVLIISTHNISAALDAAALDVVLRAYAEAFKYIGGLVVRGEDLARHLDGAVPTPAFKVRG